MTSTYEDRTQLATDVAIKAPCRAATTANITLSGLQTIDGIVLVADDRVLVKNQTSGKDNGIYLASTGAWTRTTDFDGNRDAADGTLVLVRLGTASALALYELSCSPSPPIIGTTSLTFNLVSVVVGNAGSFTTLTASGQITSGVATGTAPLVITSTTKVANLNVDLLDGTDWRAPGPIGGTTPDTGAFTTIAGTLTTAAQPNVTSTGTLVTGSLTAMGTGSGTTTTIGKANINTSVVGNVGGGTDDLMTYSLPANSLSADGKAIRTKAWGTTANNANAKTLAFVFGGSSLGTLLTISIAGAWIAECLVVRTGANAQRSCISITETVNGSSPVAAPKSFQATTGSPGQTDTAAITVKFTGSATADNDIVQNGMIVEFLN